MGVATAKILGRDHTLVLADVRQDRLDDAAGTLEALGIGATLVNCDVTDRSAVEQLFRTAAELGDIASVIHTAGVSPSMGDAEYVMTTNALGTLNVNEVFFAVAPDGAAIVNVASMASHMLPDELIPTKHFDLAFTDEPRFLAELLAVCDIAGAGDALRAGVQREQGVRPVVQHLAGRTVQLPRAADRLGVAGLGGHRDGIARG